MNARTRNEDARIAAKWLTEWARNGAKAADARRRKADKLMARHDPPITDDEAFSALRRWEAEEQAARVSAFLHTGPRPDGM